MENNSLWLRFTIETGGTLGFNLIPASTAISEDYDFMIFGPNVSCGNLGSPIRCSSTNPQAAGSPNNHTGMNGSNFDISEGPGDQGNNWIQWLTVTAGQSYFLLIDRPLGNSAFTLNWTGTATLKKTYAGTDKVGCKGKSITMNATETGTWIAHPTNPSTVNFSSLSNPTAVVNGFTSTGIYKFTWSSLGCADTVQVSIGNNSSITTNKSICQGQSFNGHNATGIYKDTFLSANGCDSIVQLNLTVNQPTSSSIQKTICQGETFLGRTTTGTYTDILVNVKGCDSVRTLSLTVNPTHATTIVKGICQNESYMGKSSTGIYTFSYKNKFGCDSIITLDLQVRDYSNVVINAAICQGQTLNGKSTTGTYIDSFKSSEGCDSFRTLHLVVNPVSYSTIYDTICDGRSLGGHTKTGTYVDVLKNKYNCDSTRTLHLFVKPNSFFTINKTICEGESFLGRNASGNYSDIFVSANGCDSTRYLNLWVTKKTINSVNKIICEGENFMGYNQTGFYRDTLRTANPCDSIITLLTLYVVPKDSFLSHTICEGYSYLGYTKTGLYHDNIIDQHKCPRIRHLDLKVNPITYGHQDTSICFGTSYKGKSKSGQYTIQYKNVNGCDSFFSLNLTVKPDFLTKTLRDTSTCTGNPLTLRVRDDYKSYLWSDGISSFEREVTQSDLYIVTITNHDDCNSSDSSEIYFYPIPKVELGIDTTIYQGESLKIIPEISKYINFEGLKWSPDFLFDCDTCFYHIIQPKENTYVKLNYVDRYTCKNEDSIYITVLPVQDIGFPTAFSPNGDGVNDVFQLNGGPIKNMSISIFNRWGELVYEYTGKTPRWTGTYKGQSALGGLYIYTSKLQLYNGKTIEKSGNINLIR